jgi:putative endonuclease
MYQVYILKNAAGRSYIGVTEDVETRLAQHNSGVSTWTRGKGPWVLDWLSRPLDLGEARKLENLLKRQKGGGGLQKLKSLHGS